MILEVVVIVGGREYKGTYSVNMGVISITCPSYGGKTAQIDGVPGRLLARKLLTEIIEEAIARGDLAASGIMTSHS